MLVVEKSLNSFLQAIEQVGRDAWDQNLEKEQVGKFSELLSLQVHWQGKVEFLQRVQSLLRKPGAKGAQPDKRPVFVATRIADIFLLKGWKIGFGRLCDMPDPSGPFCTTVAFAFQEFGLTHDFQRACAVARDYANNRMAQEKFNPLFSNSADN